VPPITTNNLTINKTARGMTHAPAGNPVTVPPGGTITSCNRKRRGNVRLTVTMDGDVTFTQVLRPGDCVTLTVGSDELPNGQYTVSDPPTVMKLIGTRGSTFSFR
jgi:hypothetical protein